MLGYENLGFDMIIKFFKTKLDVKICLFRKSQERDFLICMGIYEPLTALVIHHRRFPSRESVPNRWLSDNLDMWCTFRQLAVRHWQQPLVDWPRGRW